MRTSLKLIISLGVIVGLLVVTGWLLDKSLSPNTREMTAVMAALQGKANQQPYMLVENVLYNRLAGITRLGHLSLLSLACPVPSTALRFVPLFGKALFIVRYREYVTCMKELLARRRIILLSWACLVCAAGGLGGIWMWMLGRRELSEQEEQEDETREVTDTGQEVEKILSKSDKAEEPLHEDEDVDKGVSGDNEKTDFEKQLWQRVPFITEQQLRALTPGRLLGCGSFGSVRQIVYEDTMAVVKELLDTDALLPLLREACMMLLLEGAGGVPRVLALCLNPPAVVEEFVGQTYDKYLRKCSVGGFLDSLLSISSRLEEIHTRGIVHNDLKVDNITFTGSAREPVFHLIDLGWACHKGEVAGLQLIARSARPVRAARRNVNQIIYESSTDDGGSTYDGGDEFEYDDEAEDSEYCEWRWMAPEVRVGRRVWPSGDVYSLGVLVEYVVSGCQQSFLTVTLLRLARQCTQWDPPGRPALTQVVEAITDLISKLLPHQLTQRFRYNG